MSGADDSYLRDILKLERLLRAYLHRFGPKPADLDDLLQETYTRLLAVDESARSQIASTQAFALTIARNVAVDWTRRRKTVPFDLVEDLDALPVSSHESSVEELVGAHQELLRLAQAVARLPDRCAEVFTLRKVYGFTQQEIAEYCGISISTVENHLMKAAKRCKEHMERTHLKRSRDEPGSRLGRWLWTKGKSG